jgi:hypothetical protein
LPVGLTLGDSWVQKMWLTRAVFRHDPEDTATYYDVFVDYVDREMNDEALFLTFDAQCPGCLGAYLIKDHFDESYGFGYVSFR